MFTRIKQWLELPVFLGTEDDQKAARNLAIIILAAFAAYSISLFLNLALDTQDFPTSAVALAGCILQAVSWWLLRRGHLRASSLSVALGGIGAVTFFSTVGQGIRDIALLALPVIFIFASLTLDRASFRVCVGLALAAVSWLALGEADGWFTAQPFPDPSNWLHLTITTVILLLAAVAVDLLAANLRENLSQARLEIARRKQAESTLNESEEKYRALVENMQDIIFSVNVEGRLTFVSPQIRSFGYEPADVIAKPFSEFIHPEDRSKIVEAFAVVLVSGSEAPVPIAFRVLTKGRQIRWLEETDKLQRNRNGEIVGITGIMRDVTVSREAERAARIISEVQQILLQPCELADIYTLVSEKAHELIGDCITGVSMFDEASQTTRGMAYRGIDVPVEKLLGMFGSNIMEMPIPLATMTAGELKIYRSGNLERLEDGLYTLVSSFVPRSACVAVEKILRARDVYSMGFVHDNQHLGALTIVARTDIAPYKNTIEQLVNLASLAINRRRAEEALQVNEQQLAVIYDNAPGILFYLAVEPGERFRFISINRAFVESTGLIEDQVVGKMIEEVIPAAAQPLVLSRYREAIRTKQTVRWEEVSVYPTGERNGEVSVTPVFDAKGICTHLIGIVHDITERKRAEEAVHLSETRYRQAIMAAEAVPYYRDYQKDVEIYTFMGEGILQLTGYSAAEITPKIFDQLEQEAVMRGSLARLTSDEAGKLSKAGQILHWACDYRIKTRDGQTRWVSDSAVQVRDENNHRLGVIGILQDITERKQAEEKLRATLEEKETLLHEVHHRVKNNLQVIIALIKMRSSSIHDDGTQQFLKELEGQAHTMSLVYEQLYQAENLSQVDMEPYLRQLTSNVLDTFGHRHAIQLELDAPLMLDVAQAMPCGLIVNELFSNILKYAFPPGFKKKPEVIITLKQDGETYHLTISDNGAGLPSGFDWQSGQSLGLRLVNLWATHQLGGTINVTDKTGTTFAIAFEVNE